MDIGIYIDLIEHNLRYFDYVKITIRKYNGRIAKHYIQTKDNVIVKCTQIANEVGDGHKVINIESYVFTKRN